MTSFHRLKVLSTSTSRPRHPMRGTHVVQKDITCSQNVPVSDAKVMRRTTRVHPNDEKRVLTIITFVLALVWQRMSTLATGRACAGCQGQVAFWKRHRVYTLTTGRMCCQGQRVPVQAT
ncbi:hypothetical protein NP493_360g03008 [Ridgeia piscesae]|uniref:Uncharacterized protein n=1 Tax=Ridgeia piscesae TaxID=27915 RepID=A0AAD9L3S6_RIDPI|nr:hypothetical protein NP493_360g03008 [Ridgeia piscesae]